MTTWYQSVLCVFLLCCGNLAFAQTKPETLKAKVFKIERIRDEQEGALWYNIKISFRDNSGKIYRVWAACISTNPDSPASCGKIAVPRVGLSYDILNYADISVQFTGDKSFYEIVSIELDDCR